MADQDNLPHEVTAVARRHGVDPAQVKEVLGGVANRAFALGESLFLRISRPGFERDLLKETQVVPLARSVGVRTPDIVEYDDTHQLIDAPYVVMQRVHGVEPTKVPTGLAEQLATLHQLRQPPARTTNSATAAANAPEPHRTAARTPEAPRTGARAPGPADATEAGAPTARRPGAGAIDSGAPEARRSGAGAPRAHGNAAAGPDAQGPGAGATEADATEARMPGVGVVGGGAVGGGVGGGELGVEGWGDPWGTVEELVDRGYVDSGTGTWLADWFKRLAERIDGSGPNVLIHGDVAAHNLLAGPQNDLRALIDWGDAAWAPPAMDFAKLPLTDVALILPAYLHHTQLPRPLQSGDTAGRVVGLVSDQYDGNHERPVTGRPSTSSSEEEFAAAVLWFHLSWALAKLSADPWPGQRHWTAPTTSRLLGVLQFFTSSPPAPWSGLV